VSGPTLDCRDCRSSRYCGRKPEQARRSLFAWSRGEDEPGCLEFSPRWLRGIDGVYLSPAPPRGYAARADKRVSANADVARLTGPSGGMTAYGQQSLDL
jgi:hypothetical protein